jgi:hypothetical protein
MNPMAAPLRQSIRWALILGGAGFAAGFFGPMVLNPEANIGPIVGILFSGPVGAVAGALLGALFGASPVSPTTQQWILALACASLALGTLYYCLPDPAVRGYVIEAQVESCAPPTRSLDEAADKWDQAVARVTWAAPTANWKETAIANVRGDPGVVLTLGISRKAAMLRHRRPWDANRTSAGPWVAVAESKQYYADDEGSACAPYLARPRQLYWPAIDPDSDPTKPSRIWPPTETLGFLQLQRLEAVPAEYQRLLP